MPDLAIKVENVSKAYTIWRDPAARLKHPFLDLAGELFPALRPRIDQKMQGLCTEFYALKDVSFEVKKGESVGIIGRNGSGKSTLLQIIAGTLQPTGGSVTVNGRVAALLELGSGFNPEFTGRENVYLNCSILGLTKEETDARFQSIADFADIGDFIDQPIKIYSSGMTMRLAFAVQSQVSPDILIVDEALAVGDAKFQAKCFDRLKRLKEGGTTIILVTHSGEQIVTHCSKAIMLDRSKLVEIGSPRLVVNQYIDLLHSKEKTEIYPKESLNSKLLEKKSSNNLISYSHELFVSRPGYNHNEYRWGDRRAEILDFILSAEGEVYPATIISGQEIKLEVSIRFNQTLIRPIFGITIKTKEGVTIYGTNSEYLNLDDFKYCGQQGQVVVIKADMTCRLAPGDYFISLGVATHKNEEIIPHDRRYDVIHLQVRPENSFFGLVDIGINLAVNKVIQC